MGTPNEKASSEDFEFKALEQAKNYRNAIMREFGDRLKGHVAEIGAGIGQITESILNSPYVETVTAIEPDQVFHETFRSRLPEVELIEGSIDQVDLQRKFQSAVMVNVLEHIEHDMDELKKIHACLTDSKGHLCILVPARQELFSKLDDHFGHFRRYDKGLLRTALHGAGFQIEKLHYFNLIGYFMWGLRYTLMGGMTFNASHVRLFDRAIFPPTNWFESRICRPPFGQSLIAIAKAI